MGGAVFLYGLLIGTDFVTLNDPERRNTLILRYFSEFDSFAGDYVRVVELEDGPIIPQNIVFQFI